VFWASGIEGITGAAAGGPKRGRKIEVWRQNGAPESVSGSRRPEWAPRSKPRRFLPAAFQIPSEAGGRRLLPGPLDVTKATSLYGRLEPTAPAPEVSRSQGPQRKQSSGPTTLATGQDGSADSIRATSFRGAGVLLSTRQPKLGGPASSCFMGARVGPTSVGYRGNRTTPSTLAAPARTSRPMSPGRWEVCKVPSEAKGVTSALAGCRGRRKETVKEKREWNKHTIKMENNRQRGEYSEQMRQSKAMRVTDWRPNMRQPSSFNGAAEAKGILARSNAVWIVENRSRGGRGREADLERRVRGGENRTRGRGATRRLRKGGREIRFADALEWLVVTTPPPQRRSSIPVHEEVGRGGGDDRFEAGEEALGGPRAVRGRWGRSKVPPRAAPAACSRRYHQRGTPWVIGAGEVGGNGGRKSPGQWGRRSREDEVGAGLPTSRLDEGAGRGFMQGWLVEQLQGPGSARFQAPSSSVRRWGGDTLLEGLAVDGTLGEVKRRVTHPEPR